MLSVDVLIVGGAGWLCAWLYAQKIRFELFDSR